MHPLRDQEGVPLPINHDIKGTYPWMDRSGNNIVFTNIKSLLNHDPDNPRYSNSKLEGVADEDVDLLENRAAKSGFTIMGLWTQGKMVLMDNLLNGSDYGIEARRAQHRLVDLYNDNIAVRVGSMRTNSLKELPTFSLGNLTFFDSIENMMNYNDNMRPNKPNDVVWWISDGKSTDQFSFDDYLYLASNSARDRKFHIEVNGTSVSGQVTYNTAGAGKQSWQNVTIPNIELPKGFKRCASFLIEQDKTSIPSKLAPQVNHKNPRH